MLINNGITEKEDLLKGFTEVYETKMELPINAEKILANNIVEKDYYDVLKFGNNCLRYLAK